MSKLRSVRMISQKDASRSASKLNDMTSFAKIIPRLPDDFVVKVDKYSSSTFIPKSRV